MISPELLRQHPFFGMLDDRQQKAIAMIADEVAFQKDIVLFREGQDASVWYFLLDGSVDLYFYGAEDPASDPERGMLVGAINPGEPFAISAVIEPHVFTSTARTARPSRAIKIEAGPLRALFEEDRRLAFVITRQAARAAMDRLNATRVQLAAALA